MLVFPVKIQYTFSMRIVPTCYNPMNQASWVGKEPQGPNPTRLLRKFCGIKGALRHI